MNHDDLKDKVKKEISTRKKIQRKKDIKQAKRMEKQEDKNTEENEVIVHDEELEKTNFARK
jgi:hypothetical protein